MTSHPAKLISLAAQPPPSINRCDDSDMKRQSCQFIHPHRLGYQTALVCYQTKLAFRWDFALMC